MQRINALLNQPELNTILAHQKAKLAAQKIWETIAPDNLAKLSHASAIQNQQLTIFTYNNTVAAKIKNFIPSLLITLQNQGCEVTSIRLKVQVKSNPQIRPKTIKKLSTQAATDLNQLAKKLSGTELGDALTRLAKKAN